MNFSSRALIVADLSLASMLDRKWFGEYGISEVQLNEYINQHPTESISLLVDNIFSGFATFELLNEGSRPSDYVGEIPNIGKVLFIQQFTTKTNYSKEDMSMDVELLRFVELKAAELGCVEVWEALATTHPYSEKANSKYDAFGFYTNRGYSFDVERNISWEPDSKTSVPCYLFRKKLSKSLNGELGISIS